MPSPKSKPSREDRYNNNDLLFDFLRNEVEVHMKDGKPLKGILNFITRDQIALQVDNLYDFVIMKDDISYVVREDPLFK